MVHLFGGKNEYTIHRHLRNSTWNLDQRLSAFT